MEFLIGGLIVCWMLVMLLAASEGALAATNRVRLRQWLQTHAATSSHSLTVQNTSVDGEDDNGSGLSGDAQRYIATVTIAANVPLLVAAALCVELVVQRNGINLQSGLWSAVLGLFTIIAFQMAPRLIVTAQVGGEMRWWFAIVRVVIAALRPFVGLLMFLGTLILRPLGLLSTPRSHQRTGSRAESSNEQAESAGTEEILDLVESAHDAGTLEEGGRELIESIFAFGDTRVHEVMVPRPDIVALSVDCSPERAIETLQSSGFSRIPIYEGDIDHVVGVLHVKDILRAVERDVPWTAAEVMRKPLYIPESQTIDAALTTMRGKRTHLSLVMDEFGGTAGLLTVEDILEELVGEIADEHDHPDSNPLQILDEHTAIADALLHVEDLRDEWELVLPTGEYDTVGGFMIERLGRPPVVGDMVETPDATLTVQSVRSGRVRKIFIALKPRAAEVTT